MKLKEKSYQNVNKLTKTMLMNLMLFEKNQAKLITKKLSTNY